MIVIVLALFALVGCTTTRNDATPAAGAPARTSTVPVRVAAIDVRPELGRHFDSAGVRGAVLVYDDARDLYITSDSTRIARGYIPASTFKIFNSLVALDNGAVRDEHEIVRWDSVDRGSAGWNADQDMATAFARSSVWFYQVMARRVGREPMERALVDAQYGNRRTGPAIDRFWLDGDLRISMLEQIRFLVRLQQGRDLPFSPRAMEIVRRIMIRDTVDGAVVRGKTGWAQPSAATPVSIGWWVGWIEKDGRTTFFATNLETDDPKKDIGPMRRQITEAVLREIGMM